MKKVMTLAVLLITVIAAAAMAVDAPKADMAAKPAETTMKAQEKCPIEGNPINKTFFADHEGMRIYFCSENCIAEFKKDPAKFVQKMKDEGIELEKAPAPAETSMTGAAAAPATKAEKK